MKRKVLLAILILTLNVSIFAKDSTPEFDGVYLQTKSNKFIEMTSYRPDSYMSYVKHVDSNRLCNRDDGMKPVKIKLSQLKYLVLKGQRYSAEHFEKKTHGNRKGEFCESYETDKLKIRTKTKGDTEYYQLRGLKKGDIYEFISAPYRYYIQLI